MVRQPRARPPACSTGSRTQGGDTALALLAINPGTDAATRARFDYVGFKGGSEPGVITLNYLVRRKDGRWLAIVGNWHRTDAGVDTGAFTQLDDARAGARGRREAP